MTESAPTLADQRIQSIDVLRGLVVLGILIINIQIFGQPIDLMLDPYVLGPISLADQIVFYVSTFGVEGSQRLLFSMLFGAGIILLTDRLEATDRGLSPRAIYFRRTFLLIGFGFVDMFVLLWYGDILTAYGIGGLILYWLRKWKARNLLILGLVVVALILLMRVALYSALEAGMEMGPELLAKQEAGELLTPGEIALLQFEVQTGAEIRDIDIVAMNALIEAKRDGFVSTFIAQLPLLYELQVVNSLYIYFWDILSAMIIGMALFKWKIFDASRSTRFYSLMAVFGITIGLGANCYEQFFWDSSIRPILGLQWTYDIARYGLGLGYLGIVMLICKSGRWASCREWFAATGRMALTNYLLASLLCMVLFILFRTYGYFALHQLIYVVIGIWVIQLLFSKYWLSRYRYGPCEWVWRSMTYGKWLSWKSETH